MSKPTILQSLLGRPSQTYYFPAAREYHSTKHDLLRSVSPTSIPDLDPSQAVQPMPAGLPINKNGRPLSSFPASSDSQHSSSSPGALSPRYTNDTDSMTHGPKSSSSSRHLGGEHSLGPSKPLTHAGAGSGSTPVSHSPPVLRVRANPSSRPGYSISRGVEVDSDVGTTTDDEQDEDLFYTPRSSFHSSPRASRSSATMFVDPKVLVSALLPSAASQPVIARPLSHSRASSESSLSSASSSANSSEADSATSSRATTSTRITTPINSDNGNRRHIDPAGGEDVETITISSSKIRSNSIGVRERPRSAVTSLSERRNRTQNEMRRLTYTDEDWAKDVRWLSPPSSSHRRANSVDSATTSTRTYSRSSRPQGLYPPESKSAERRQRSSTRRSRGSRGSRGRMSALLEEDESDSTDITPGGSSTEISRPPSPVPELPASSDSRDSSTPKTGPLQTSLARSKSQRSTRSSSAGMQSMKRTTSPEPRRHSGDIGEDIEAIEALESPDARVQAYAQSHRRSYSHTRPLSRSFSLSRPDPSLYAKTLPTHSLPTPHLSSDSPPLSGYSGLTMAHAGYVGKGKALGGGKVDMVKAGVAQSTMATVEVVFGSAQSTLGTSSPLLKKRKTLSATLKFLSRTSGRRKEGSTPRHLVQELPLPVAFTAHLPPPSFISPSHVLIQVFAVGLDALDSSLVHDKVGFDRAKSRGSGFIPGRSVVGRAIECGWEVRADVCKKGDWVIGLLELQKSGALAEFVALERHRLHRAPQPRSRPTTLFPSVVNRRSHVRSMSLPSHLHSLPSITNISVGDYHQPSIEELALLPLNALFAHRAVRTLADAIVSTRSPLVSQSTDVAAGSSALILHGHDGPGAMAVQMLSKRGVRVCVQVPTSALYPRSDKHYEDAVGNEGPPSNGHATERLISSNTSVKRSLQAPTSTTEARLLAWGAQDVCIGDPVDMIERLVAEGQCFDAVIDTVGGAEIWIASQKLLLAVSTDPSKIRSSSSHAQFTTLIGDNPAKPIPSAHDHIRSGFRSVRRTINVPLPVESNVEGTKLQGSPSKKSSTSSLPLPRMHSRSRSVSKSRTTTVKRTVGYAWVSVAADVDYEGEDIRDALGSVVGMVEEGWIQPWIGDGGSEEGRVVPFDRAPELFRRDSKGPVGLLQDGGTCVVKIVP